MQINLRFCLPNVKLSVFFGRKQSQRISVLFRVGLSLQYVSKIKRHLWPFSRDWFDEEQR